MTTPNFNRYAWLAGVCAMLATSVSYTAPGVISDTPLFTATSSSVYAPSNIVFLLDDSGSMGWDYLYARNWQTTCYQDVVTCTASSNIFKGDNGSGDWRDNSKDVNIMEYNPSVTYIDWKKGDGTYYHATSTNPNGNAALSVIPNNFSFDIWTDNKGFTGSIPSVTSSAPINGSPATSGTSGQTSFRTNKTITLTYNMTTTGGNGVVDYWDTHTTFALTSSTATAFTITQTDAVMTAYTQANTPLVTTTGNNPNKVSTYTIGNVLTYQTSTPTSPTVGGYDASVGGFNGRTLAQEKQNIANWYAYYRTRINVAKGAIGMVVDANPNYRYGLNTIWNAVFVEVPSLYSTGTTIRTDFVTPNIALLNTLYGLWGSPNTPLPDALERVGMYYAGKTIPKPNSSNLSNSSISTTSWTAATTSSTNSYAKPIVYECQQNFAILMTDGYWNQELGSTNGGITSLVNNYTGANGHKGDVDQDGVVSTKTSGGTSSTSVNATLADVARYYYITDLDTTLANKVPINTNPIFTDSPAANWQHMVTFTIAFGLQGVLVDTDTDPTAAGYGWPDPLLSEKGNWGKPWGTGGSGGTDTNIDDLWHAAYNGRGMYVSASSPEAISQGFADVLSNISKRDYAGSASSASFNFSSASGSNAAYVSQFGLISNIWSGDLLAFTLDSSTGLPSTTIAWSAATQLDALNTSSNKAAAATSRHIFTYNPALKTGVPFQWTNLSAGTTSAPTISLAQQDLGTDTSGTITTGSVTTADPKALARLNFLRGDQTNEGTSGYSFRKRSYTDTATPPVTHNNLLGDIIHSDPLLVSVPQGAWPARSPFSGTGTSCTPTYKSFKTTWKTRAPMVYAGANDGMLHAFNALTGNEAMGYIPNILYSAGSPVTGLHYLTDSRYTGQNHRYYVDGIPVVEDVCINTTNTTSTATTTTPLAGATWHTVLVGGLNEGGRGVYALDITDPSLFNTENTTNAAKIAMWEFKSSDDSDMGYSFSVPNIVMMNNGRWAAVFGNGYNNAGSGKAALFIVFLEGGFDGVWTLGTDYIKIMLPTPSTNPNGVDSNGSGTCIASTDNCNGLSTVQTLDLNADGVIDRVYGGDLKGQMWAIDVCNLSTTTGLCSTATTSWGSAYGTTSAPAPLFTASHYATPYTLDTTGAPTVATGLPVPCGFTTASPTVITCSSSATFTSRTRQPITTRPTLMVNTKSYGYNQPNILVMFGTGQYLNLPDTGNTDMQTFYGVWDHGTGSLTPATAQLSTTGSATTTPAFVQQIYLPGPFMYTPDATTANPNPVAVDISVTNSLGIAPIRQLSNLPVSYSNTNPTNQGWFINMPIDSTYANRMVSQGERQIVNTDILDNKYLFFNTWIPGATTNTTVSANSCVSQGNSAGSGYLMSVSAFTGGAADKSLFSIAGSTSMNSNNTVKNSAGTAFNAAGRAYTTGLPASSSFVKGLQYTPGTNGGSSLNGTAVVQTLGDQMQRRAWQEIRNN